MKDEIEEITRKIFTKSQLKKAFTERELKEMFENDNFYKPETLWFTKEMIEADIPRIIKIIKSSDNEVNPNQEIRK